MRAAVDLVARDIKDSVVVFRQEQPLYLAAALGVDALPYDMRRWVLAQVRGADARGDRDESLRLAVPRTHAVQRLHDRAHVVRRRAAAAANDRHSAVAHELCMRPCEAVGVQRVYGCATLIQRDTRVRDDADRHGGMFRQQSDRLTHVFRPGRAVEPDHIDVQCL